LIHRPAEAVVLQVLAAFIAIPYGLSVLMRGSDGLNKGRYGRAEAGVLAAVGGLLILTSLAMLLGLRYAGFLAVIALVAGLATNIRRRRIDLGRLTAGDVAGQASLTLLLTVLILAGL
jgi:hypothetical protein